MINYKITKTQKLDNEFFKVFGRFYNTDNTRYRNFKYITKNKNDFSSLNLIKDYDNNEDFYNFCNNSLKDYYSNVHNNTKDFEIKNIRTTLIKEGGFGWKFYSVKGWLVNYKLKKKKSFSFVINYDFNDICEDLEKENFTKKEEKEYKDFLISSMFDYIKDFEDTKYFYEICNNTIENYNNNIYNKILI